MGLLDEIVRRIVRLERRVDGLVHPERAYQYQPITLVKGWDGATNKADQTLDLQSAPWSLPSGIKAVSVFLSYTAANNADYGRLMSSSGDDTHVLARAPDASEYGASSGIVNCDANGDIYFETNNTTNTVYLYITGYFI